MKFIIAPENVVNSGKVLLLYPKSKLYTGTINSGVAEYHGNLANCSVAQLTNALALSEEIIYTGHSSDWNQCTAHKLAIDSLLCRFVTELNKEVVGFSISEFLNTYKTVPPMYLRENELDHLVSDRLAKIFNFNKHNYLGKLDFRQHKGNQLWVAGCSFAHGGELPDKNMRYGQLVAEWLNIPVSFLTQGGSSIDFQANQILRSNIKSGDTLIWGLTGVNRFTWHDENKSPLNGTIFHVFNTFKKVFTKDLQSAFLRIMTDDNSAYSALKWIEAITDYCNFNNVRLVLIDHPELNIESHYKILNKYLQNHPNFVNVNLELNTIDFTKVTADEVDRSDMYFDICSDNMHPGPKTHEHYANKIIDSLK